MTTKRKKRCSHPDPYRLQKTSTLYALDGTRRVDTELVAWWCDTCGAMKSATEHKWRYPKEKP